MKTFLAAFVGGLVAVLALRGIERWWDGHPSAALAAARLLQRAELDLDCVAEKLEQRVIALTPPAARPFQPSGSASEEMLADRAPAPSTTLMLAAHDASRLAEGIDEAAVASREQPSHAPPAPARAAGKPGPRRTGER